MKYVCNNCDITFESESETKPRCPECMGINDVEEAGEKASDDSKKERPKFFGPAAILLTVIGIACVYFAYQKYTAPQTAPGQQFDADDVRSQFKVMGLDIDATVPFEVTDSVKKYATSISEGKNGHDAVKAIFNKLLSLMKEKKIESFLQIEPRSAEPLTADKLLDKIKESKDPWQATSYELSCFLYAAAKSLDVENLSLVEIFYYKAEKIPADPSAIYSRFGVLVEDKIYDVWAKRVESSKKVDFEKLSATEATAPYYAHVSLSDFAKLDLQEALKNNKIAVDLAPGNASLKIHRGKIFLGSGPMQEAMNEFEKAKQTKDWAITKVALAQISLMSQNTAGAEADIQEALKTFPDYHQARSLLAAVYMMRGDITTAKQELEIAGKQSPNSPEVAATYAQLYAMEGDSENAILMGKKAARLSKENFQSLMILAQIYRATARFDEMRETAQKAISKAPSDAVKQELMTAFGVSEESDDDEELAETEEVDSDEVLEGLSLPAPNAGDLKLNLKNEAAGPRLGGSGLKLGNRPSLGGGNLELKLDQE